MKENILYKQMRKLVMASALVFLIGSCKKEDSKVGLELQPESDKVRVLNFNAADIKMTTVIDEVSTTQNLSRVLIGQIEDPIMGKRNASFYAQIKPAGDLLDLSFFTQSGNASDLVVDSVLLSLSYYPDEILYGTDDAQTIEVFKITEDWAADSSYVSNAVLGTDVTNLNLAGSNSINISDSVMVDGVKQKAAMLLKLNATVGQEIVDLSASQSLTADNFSTFFRGLQVKSNSALSMGTGGIAQIDLSTQSSATYFRIYMRDAAGADTTIAYNLFLNSGNRFTQFNFDYTGTDVDVVLNDDTFVEGQDQNYVSTGYGLQSLIALPNLDSLAEDAVINQALLYVYYDASNISKYPVPETIYVTYYSEDSTLNFVSGLSPIEIASNFVLNEAENRYEFYITRHVQQILNGSINTQDIILSAGETAVSANRAVLEGPGSLNKPIELRIVYSKL